MKKKMTMTQAHGAFLHERKTKKMTRKTKIIGIMVLVVTLLAGTVLAQGYGRRGGGMRGNGMGGNGMNGYGAGPMGGNIMMALWNLDLTDGQQDEIEAIMTEARDQIEELQENIPENDDRSDFIEVFTSPDLSVADLEEQFGNNSDFMEEMQSIMFQAIVDVHDVLTDEQLVELAELAEDFSTQGGFRGGRGPGGGFRGGSGGVPGNGFRGGERSCN